MPIYCYECGGCKTIIEKMVPMGEPQQELCTECGNPLEKIPAQFTNTNKKVKNSTAETRVKEFIEDARRTLDSIKSDLQEDME